MKNLYGFPEMAKIIPEAKSGKWAIQHQVATAEKAREKQMMGIYKRDWTWRGFEAGTYCVLTNGNGYGGEIMMSDTWLERFTNLDILRESRGDVLLAGLGIGLIPSAIAHEVNSITVLEIEPDVITLIEAPLRKYLKVDSNKLNIIQEDAFKHIPTRKFDVIYFDIWQDICGDNYEETKTIHKRFRKYLKQGGWMDSWLRDEVRRLSREG